MRHGIALGEAIVLCKASASAQLIGAGICVATGIGTGDGVGFRRRAPVP